MLIKFDPKCPHQTANTGQGFRVSIDFRTRKNCCYKIKNKIIDSKLFSNEHDGHPFGLGYYWTIPKDIIKSYKEKKEFELFMANKINEKAYKLRLDYFKNFEHKLRGS